MSAVAERELKARLEEHGWSTIRGAGSLGLDLVTVAPFSKDLAWMPNVAIFIEVKTTKKKAVYISGERLVEQWNKAKSLAGNGRNVIYGVRWKTGKPGEKWEFFNITKNSTRRPLRRGEGITFDLVFKHAAL